MIRPNTMRNYINSERFANMAAKTVAAISAKLINDYCYFIIDLINSS